MKYRVERIRLITREFAAMRGEPNAVGIPTKMSPSNKERAFFTDLEFDENKAVIDAAFADVARAFTDSMTVIVIPLSGLGTGRAQLSTKAPRTFDYLHQKLADLSLPES